MRVENDTKCTSERVVRNSRECQERTLPNRTILKVVNLSFFFPYLLFYVALTSWVISDVRRRCFLYVVVDLGLFQIL